MYYIYNKYIHMYIYIMCYEIYAFLFNSLIMKDMQFQLTMTAVVSFIPTIPHKMRKMLQLTILSVL